MVNGVLHSDQTNKKLKKNEVTMKTGKLNIQVLKLITVVSIVSFMVISCGDSSTDSEPEFNVQTVSHNTHGEVLADGDGNVLYYYSQDVSGESNCEGECIDSWPVFHVTELDPDENLNADDFGTIEHPEAGSQTIYKGWPLYYFSGDEEAGDVTGDGALNEWFVAKPDHSLMNATGQLVGADEENYIVDDEGNYSTGEGSTNYVTDAEGRALYIFTSDSTNTNNCRDGCSDNWPVFHADIESLPSNIDRNHLDDFTAHGDRQQLTYKGWPLYYFDGDEDRGDTKGVSVPEPGVWPVLQNDIEAAPGYTDEDDDSDDDTDPGY